MLGSSRGGALVAAALLLHLSLALTQDAAQSAQPVEGDEDEGKITFSEIAGFALKAKATVQRGRSKRGCELICVRAPSCKSYSFRASDRTCVVSAEALTYDPEFVFASKSHPEDKKQGYHFFDGLTYKSAGWMKTTGKSQEQCEKLCTEASTCKAFSYRDRDETCLLSTAGIEYSPEFSYYEKNVPKYSRKPKVEKAPGTSVHKDGSHPLGATQNPKLISLEMKEKAARHAADLAKKKEEVKLAKNKATIAKMKLDEKAGVAEEHESEQKKFAEDEHKLSLASNEKFAKMKNQASVEYQQQEQKNKLKEEEAQRQRTQERSRKNMQKIKDSGERKIKRALGEAKSQADIEVKKLQLAATFKDTQREINKATVDEASANKAQQMTDKRDATIKAQEEKNEKALSGEVNQKFAIQNGDMEVMQKKITAHTLDATRKIKEESREKIDEHSTKNGIRRKEFASKESARTAAKESALKLNLQNNDESRVEDEAEKKRVQMRLKKARAETLEAIKQRDLAVQSNKMTELQGKSKTQMDVYQLRIRQKSAEVSSKELNTNKMTVFKESSHKRLREVQETASRDTMNVKKQDLKKAMDAREGDINATKAEVKATYDKRMALRHQATADRDVLRSIRGNMSHEMYNELTVVKEELHSTIILKARQRAKEKIAKAHWETDNTVAKGAALGRMHLAEMKEQALRIPGDRVKREKEVLGIVNLVITSDVASFVDSGAPTANCTRCGSNLPALREAYMVEKMHSRKMEIVYKDEVRLHDMAEIKNKNGKADANRTRFYARKSNDLTLERVKNQTDATIMAVNATLGAMPDFSEIQDSMNNISNGAYASLVNVPNLSSFVPGGVPGLGDEQADLLELEEDDELGNSTNPANASNSTPAPTAPTPTPTAPTPAPTAAPTINQTAMAEQAQAEANELKMKAQDIRAAEGRRENAGKKYAEAENAHKRQETYLNDVYEKTCDTLNSTLDVAVRKVQVAYERYGGTTTALNLAESKMNAVLSFPANEPFGDQPALDGQMHVQTSPDRDQKAFIKFPTIQLNDKDTITAAKLRVHKNGGPTGPIRVDVASCMWTRKSLTYTESLSLAQKRASVGLDAVFPADSGTSGGEWVTVELKADVVQNARVGGDHVCVSISGGPEDSPAILSSEQTNEPPKLDLEVFQHPQHKLNYAMGAVGPPISYAVPKDERRACQERIKRELTLMFTHQALRNATLAAAREADELLSDGQQEEAANNVVAGMEMATDAAQLEAQQIQAQTSAINQAEQAAASAQLAGMINAGMTADQMVAQAAQIGQQAQVDAANKAAAAAGSIQANAQQGLQEAQQRMKKNADADQASLQAEVAQMKKQGKTLTPSQEAMVNAKVAMAVPGRLAECAKPNSAPLPTVEPLEPVPAPGPVPVAGAGPAPPPSTQVSPADAAVETVAKAAAEAALTPKPQVATNPEVVGSSLGTDIGTPIELNNGDADELFELELLN